MRGKRILALLLALVMLFGIVVCGKKSSDEDAGQNDPEAKDYEVMDPAELVGAWRMVAWSLTDDTSYTEVEDSYMVFSDSDLKYYSAGALMTDSSYTFADEESILLVAKNDPNSKVGWVIHKTGEKTAVIIDNMNGIKYYIEKDPTIDLSQLEVNPITAEELAGTWRMYQTVSNGKTTPVYDAYMVFTENNMSYFVNGLMKTDNKYVFTGERTIKLTSKIASGSVSWGIYTNGDGELICTDPSGISYHCVRDNGLKSVSLSQLQGTYELYAWSMIYDAAYYVKKGILKTPVHFQFCMGCAGGITATVENLCFMKRTLMDCIPDCTWSAFGVGKGAMEIMYAAIAAGGNIRVGMEDNILYHKGQLAQSNMQLIARARRVIEEYGLEVATPDEARRILGLVK